MADISTDEQIIFAFTPEEVAKGTKVSRMVVKILAVLAVPLAVWAFITEGFWGLLGLAIVSGAIGILPLIIEFGARRAANYRMTYDGGQIVLPRNKGRRIDPADIDHVRIGTTSTIAPGVGPANPTQTVTMDLFSFRLKSGEELKEIPGGNVRASEASREELARRLRSLGVDVEVASLT